MANEVATTMQGYLNGEKVKSYLTSVLQERTPQFITALVSLSNLTPGLAKCDPRSIMMCGLKAISLNLPLDNNLGFAYAIPYGTDAQFQIGYKGFIQLAQRTGQYESIVVVDIRDGELQSWDPLTEKLDVIFSDDRDKRPVIGYAAAFRLRNGFSKKAYRAKNDIITHGKRFSKTFNKGPWQTDTDAMCRKTVLKDVLSKWGPMSTELMEAIKFDQSVIRQTPEGVEIPDYVDHEATPIPQYDIPEETLLQIEELALKAGWNGAQLSQELGNYKGKENELLTLLMADSLNKKKDKKGKETPLLEDE